MKKILVFLISVLASFNCLQAQVNNLNEYYLKVYFHQGVGVVDNETDGESRYHIRAGNYVNSSSPTHLLNTNVGADNIGNGATYYQYDNKSYISDSYYGPVVYLPILPDLSTSLTSVQSNTTGKFNVSVMSYAYDSEPPTRYMNSTSGNMGYLDETFEFANVHYPTREVSLLRFIDNGGGPTQDIGSYTGYGSDSYYRIKYCFRPKHGRRDDPLDFGTIVPGAAAISQYNTNRSTPNSTYYNSSFFGYANDWSEFGGNDVTYKFTLDEPQSISINIAKSSSTSSNLLIMKLMSGFSPIWTTGGSIENQALCAGTYYITLDGAVDKPVDFQISVSGTARLPSAGSISLSTTGSLISKQICPESNLGSLYSNSSANAVCGGGLSYQWEKKVNTGSWLAISGATSYFLSSAQSGNMGTASSIRFRRKVTEANGNAAYSNEVTFTPHIVNATSGGTITGGEVIPFVKEANVVIQSQTNGTASPFVDNRWEQSTNEGLSWAAVVPIQFTPTFTLPDFNDDQYGNQFNNLTEIKYRRRIQSSCDASVFINSNEVTYDVVQANGRVFGGLLAVKDRAGNGVDGIKIKVVRTTPVSGGTLNKADSAITANEGQYNIPDLYYGRTGATPSDEATYLVTPSKPNHFFDPATRTVTLTKNFSQVELSFTDTTGFSISGYITQYCASCDGSTVAEKTDSLKNIIILESLQSNGAPGNLGKKTAASGKYSTIKQNQGTYIIKPQFVNHQFSPNQTSVTITNQLLTDGIDFQDTTTRIVSGYIKMDCPIPEVGVTTLLFKKIVDVGEGTARIRKTVSTNANNNGFYATRLPAGKYLMEVIGVDANGSGLNKVDVLNFLKSYPDSVRMVDLTTEAATLDLFYHEKPQIQVFGLTAPTCSNSGATFGGALLSSYSIFNQGVPSPITVAVWEGNPSKNCRAKDDTVTLATNFSGSSEFIKLPFENGVVDTTLIGETPNVVSPFLKSLSVVFTDQWNQTADNFVAKPIILGAEASNSSFFTVSPEIPMLILRDPPGDQSYSYFEENATIETASRFYSGDALELGTWVEAKAGAKFEAGIVFSTESEFYVSLGGSLSAAKKNSSSRERINSITTSTKFKTSGNGIPGDQGDVFIGAAMNLKYSKVIEVLYDEILCEFRTKNSFAMADSGFATTYIYSKDHIENFLIPTIRQAAELAPSQGKADSLNNQASVWEQTLQRNEDLKKRAKFVKNYSFDGTTGEIDESTTASNSESMEIEFTMEMNTELAVELGMEIGGSGLKGGSNVKMRMEMGKSETTTNLKETVTGFVLDDDEDGGDKFSVNVKTDPVYGTPVFELAAGTSSCPHEEGTQFRDKFEFYVPDAIKTNIAPTAEQLFKLYLGNGSDSEEQRTYYVQFVQGSADDADVRIGTNGSATAVGINQPFGLTNSFNAYVKRALGTNEFSYDDVRFRAFDGCSSGNSQDMDVVKEVTVQAFFNNPCSPIALSIPEEGFRQNNSSLAVEFKGYDYASAFDQISFQYAFQGSNVWQTKETYLKAAYMDNAFGFQKTIDISSLPEGLYKFRARLKCGLNNINSKSINGTIDRKAPIAFGRFEPADNQYVSGDVISATFNEPINCSIMEQTDFTLKRADNNANVSATLGCYQNQILITPNFDLVGTLNGQNLLVTLAGIQDLSGNESSQTYAWDFTVGTAPASTSAYMASFVAAASQIAENSGDSVAVTFSISPVKSYDNVIYYTVGGTATAENDFNTIGQKPTSSYLASVTIAKNKSDTTIYIKPMNDGDVEADESVILTLASAADYAMGGTMSQTVTITNDDVLGDNCDNNGNPFLLSNNGGSAITPDTYHKLLLESDGKVAAPTTVIFKGEKSVTLKPGFEAEGSSVFLAITEDCPEGTPTSAFSTNSAEQNAEKQLAQDATGLGKTTKQEFSEYELTEMNEAGEIVIDFAGKSEFGLKAELFTVGGKEMDITDFVEIKNDTNDQLILNTSTLSRGEYILRMTREGRTLFHRFIVR
jgi:hypothetical protein